MSAPTASRPAPLQGVRVLDFTTVLAGPYCTYQLALLGAEVIKVERPGKGDWSREGAGVRAAPELSVSFVAQNAAKRSITLDLQTPRGKEIALQLIASADVMVENFTPGVADRLGIGYEQARGQRPDLVYCAVSGYGQTGEFSRRPAYDHVIQAISGITMLNGKPENVPNRIGPPLFDYLAGIYSAFAVLAALRERDRTGQPQMVDVAMLDVAIVAMASTVSGLLNAGVQPRANGNVAASGSPASGIFPTRDGLLSLAANQERQVARLCQAAGLEHLLQDARFADPLARREHAAAFVQALTGALAARSAREWETLLSAAHVPAARVRNLAEILQEPHLAERGVRQTVRHPASGGEIAVPSLGVRWNGQAVGPDRAPPAVGEHTASVLAELGLSPDDIARLREQKVV